VNVSIVLRANGVVHGEFRSVECNGIVDLLCVPCRELLQSVGDNVAR
jgi:hypothetical protein